MVHLFLIVVRCALTSVPTSIYIILTIRDYFDSIFPKVTMDDVRSKIKKTLGSNKSNKSKKKSASSKASAKKRSSAAKASKPSMNNASSSTKWWFNCSNCTDLFQLGMITNSKSDCTHFELQECIAEIQHSNAKYGREQWGGVDEGMKGLQVKDERNRWTRQGLGRANWIVFRPCNEWA